MKLVLKDVSVDIESIRANPHKSPEYIDAIEADVKSMSEFIEKVDVLQHAYLKFKMFYSNPRILRALTSTMKFFGEVDEFWRSLTRLVRRESDIERNYISDFLALPETVDLLKKIEHVTKSAEHALLAVNIYIDEQRVRFPRLYLIDKDFLLDVFMHIEITTVFEKLKDFLQLDRLFFDNHDKHQTIGAVSGLETIYFRSAASSRSSLVDWLRGIFNGPKDRLKLDIRELVEGHRTIVDDIKMMKSLDQARICAVQLQFSDYLTSQRRNIVHKGEEIISIISDFTQLMYDLRTKYQRVAIYNQIVLRIAQRDILKCLERDSGSGNNFFVDCALTKSWDSTSGTIEVSIMDMSIEYGMSYHTMSERLLVTPLTEKCYLALANTFRDMCVPVLTGPNGCSKSSTLTGFVREIGVELVIKDCIKIRSACEIHSSLQAAVGVGLFITFINTQNLVGRNDHLLSTLLDSILSVQSAIAGKLERVNIGGIDIMPSVKMTRLCLMFDGHIERIGSIPLSLQQLFRPITIISPQRLILIESTLAIYGIPDIENMVNKLSCFTCVGKSQLTTLSIPTGFTSCRYM